MSKGLKKFIFYSTQMLNTGDISTKREARTNDGPQLNKTESKHRLWIVSWKKCSGFCVRTDNKVVSFSMELERMCLCGSEQLDQERKEEGGGLVVMLLS